MEELEEHIWSNQKFHALVKSRNRLMWILFSLTLILFFGFALLATFVPSVFGIPLWKGAATTIGIPFGIAVMTLPFVLTGIYVHQANRDFDKRTEEILDEASKASNEEN